MATASSPNLEAATRDRRWVALARQYRVFSAADAERFGISGDALRQRASAGGLLRVGRGWYAMADRPLTWTHRIDWATRATGGVASHRSAAVLWKLEGFQASKPEVLVPFERRVRPEGVKVRRSRRWDRGEHTTRDQIGVVGPEVLVGQLASMLPRARLRAVVDQLIREHHASLTSLARFHHETPPGTAGRTVLGEVLGEYAEDQRVPMSDFSRMVADLLVGAGLPEPLLEHQFWDDDGLIQMVDLAYPGVLAIGLDSLAHHLDRATFIGDRRARNRLELLGVKVLLFTWWDYTEHPERLVAQVRAALATTSA
ncbi:type IV toxin-antitoxin system AbiEi family antitoxin domain-containing protein [Candidatus Neomicrothrix sp.]|uniref:type IV toxin-antitoxin system AbiEi family antitoxin domain-containing protein n=1 Tax=Candidatus Neomicrothrix sp. TaxID=2719034 RepID=UPI002C39F5CD|nr:type IV toxin-antitoxin system AbiEi family antitoxin domain-containing protein [Candidatus Microthrix sp.]HMS46858.1 type IV toxin-antitoxin system AbiEi family antitoxin domain-containing protein [Candidatus Microthrix sp.]